MPRFFFQRRQRSSCTVLRSETLVLGNSHSNLPKFINQRTGKPLSLEVQSGYVFDNQQDEDEAIAAISADRACTVQLRHFKNGFCILYFGKTHSRHTHKMKYRSLYLNSGGTNTRTRTTTSNPTNGSGRLSMHGRLSTWSTARPCSNTWLVSAGSQHLTDSKSSKRPMGTWTSSC